MRRSLTNLTFVGLASSSNTSSNLIRQALTRKQPTSRQASTTCGISQEAMLTWQTLSVLATHDPRLHLSRTHRHAPTTRLTLRPAAACASTTTPHPCLSAASPPAAAPNKPPDSEAEVPSFRTSPGRPRALVRTLGRLCSATERTSWPRVEHTETFQGRPRVNLWPTQAFGSWRQAAGRPEGAGRSYAFGQK